MSAEIVSTITGGQPWERLASLRDAVPGRIVFTTSFGLEDQALTHMIFTGKLPIDVVTLDTAGCSRRPTSSGRRPRRNTAFVFAPITRRPMRSARSSPMPGSTVSIIRRRRGSAAAGSARSSPLARALAGADAWVTGLRADQSGQRSGVEMASWDAERQLIKVNALVDWTRERVADFCAAEAVPINPLHAEGFLSIGCEPCTRAVLPGESERAGRWWWETDEAKECGLHVDAGRQIGADQGGGVMDRQENSLPPLAGRAGEGGAGPQAGARRSRAPPHPTLPRKGGGLERAPELTPAPHRASRESAAVPQDRRPQGGDRRRLAGHVVEGGTDVRRGRRRAGAGRP